jgi:hypothetical protein
MTALEALHLIDLAKCHAFIGEDGSVRIVGRSSIVLALAEQFERADVADNLAAWLSEHEFSRADAALGSLLQRPARGRTTSRRRQTDRGLTEA